MLYVSFFAEGARFELADPFEVVGFQDRWFKPLTHPSIIMYSILSNNFFSNIQNIFKKTNVLSPFFLFICSRKYIAGRNRIRNFATLLIGLWLERRRWWALLSLFMVGIVGFEPTTLESKSNVLPLHYISIILELLRIERKSKHYKCLVITFIL